MRTAMHRQRSALARFQQVVTSSVLACAVVWLAFHWQRAPWIGLAGFALILFSYAGFLALELVAVHSVNKDDPTPNATWAQLARAWVGETLQAPRVFCWRQPFRWNAIADRLAPAADLRGRRGVVFIHGFVCNRGFWTPWLARIDDGTRAFCAVNLEPVFGTIDDYVVQVEEAVAAVTDATGLPPVLVCHSMGGLAARAWLRTTSAARVHRVVTIASPHQGTWLARFSHTRNGAEMKVGSDWLRRLREDTRGAEAAFTCWYSNCDNVVFPSSTATLEGADNRFVHGIAHVDLAFQPEVMDATLALLRQP
jgi:hypothetical protein